MTERKSPADRQEARDSRIFLEFWDALDRVVAMVGWETVMEQIAAERAASETEKK